MQNDWSLQTFKTKLAKGEITDFTPWMENGPRGVRYIMANNGIEVEELLKDEDYEIIHRLIEHGQVISQTLSYIVKLVLHEVMP